MLKLSDWFISVLVWSMDTEPLQTLTEQSGGVGRWLLTVVMPPQGVTYNWDRGGKSGEAKKSQYLLVSEDGAQYCEGSYRRIGKEPQATDENNKRNKSSRKVRCGEFAE